MKSGLLMFLFAIMVVGGALFFKGYSRAVNLNHICDKQIPWYDAMFLDAISDKAGCEKYQ
ncbi:hypothetical protein CKO42_12210 [Lamprobacter modestohalophilus]|uniref:Uncharacterized protein n=1 Tax=Lamprobacter modestohalophilus TaxID=1064514 RepID=A0A9X1B4L9_9GAMM|nr:hypothetical protein [Lamprobacter modestohalophilus]MCF7976870.1 hypothetical protein [Chromatiaceae bacterium]MBK1619184.1 hypothetical protein [Lamprobacter modestohalophilus]MCF7996835.1 hypothetical protein [Chromatiaceae bacterium]MCF8003263.1 hypothetical protein [Chromatiaceae bacterium]MCF8017546.1 hypothetical protein [Chromatiaceae bacterium]